MSRHLTNVTPWQARRFALGCGLIVSVFLLIVLLVVVAARTAGRALDEALDQIQPGALFGAGGATAVLLGGLGAIRWSRRPRRPQPRARAAEVGRDLPALGPEPPAVAGFLASGFEVRREGLPATLLDLAARGVLEIEGIGPELRVRLRDEPEDDTLLPHERRLLALVRGRAVDGAVPAGALTSGPRQRASAWWRGFRNEVIDDAQARGLSRDLWGRRTLVAGGAASVVPASLVYAGTRNWGAAVAYLLVAFTLITWIRERRAQRDTDSGLAAAGRWADVRRFLRVGAFHELPPASVVVWERYLAYAAAFGVARAAVEAMPMGAEEDRRAWSSLGGRWREVRVRYPIIWPPAWGWLPWVALGASVVGIAAGAGLIRLGAAIGWPAPTPDIPRGFITFLRGLTLVAWTAGSLIALWSVVTLARSLGDLGRMRRATGQVVRLRTFGRSSRGPGRHYLALDDGTTEVIRAWRVPDDLWRSAPISQYRTATVTVGSFLGRVRSIEPAD